MKNSKKLGKNNHFFPSPFEGPPEGLQKQEKLLTFWLFFDKKERSPAGSNPVLFLSKTPSSNPWRCSLSQHWNALRQKTLSSQGQNVDDILLALEKTDPALAQQLRRLDWAVIRKEVAKRALDRAKAQIRGSTIETAYDNRTSYHTASGNPPKGTCVGVLKVDEAQLGVAIDGTTLLLFWNVYAQDTRPRDLQTMTKALEDAYKVEAYRAVLQLIGEGTPVEQTTPQGLVILSANLPEGGV